MNFFTVIKKETRNGLEIAPSFVISDRVDDYMTRGGDFYAVWDEERNIWSTNEYTVVDIVDTKLRQNATPESNVKYMGVTNNGTWYEYTKWKRSIPAHYVELDSSLTWLSQQTKKSDYASKRLKYDLNDADCPSWNKLIGTLYDDENRTKIEWAIGSVVTGDAKRIQKFYVLWGPPGTGKSTVLEIIAKLFDGYWEAFRVEDLLEAGNQFALEPFKTNPLVAINTDAKLSRVDTNSLLNTIVSHEPVVMNEKHKAKYTIKVNAALFIGTNEAVKITDAKSGMVRRLIDIEPTGNLFEPDEYYRLFNDIDFELGAIAKHCENVYKSLGKNYYDSYKPFAMMANTDPMYNFVFENKDIFEADSISLTRAYAMYTQYCEDSEIPYPLSKYKFREAFKSYFNNCDLDAHKKLIYSGFKPEMLERKKEQNLVPDSTNWLELKSQHSLLDDLLAENVAQYANSNDKPVRSWDQVTTRLQDLATNLTHYVLLEDLNHIVIDFDLKDETGEKSLERNIEAAKRFPPTYAEVSKSGNGLHLHYFYAGDTSKLSNIVSPGIECKVYAGHAPLRRKVSLCNDIQIATLTGGLPLKETKGMVNSNIIENEKHLRALIEKALRKEIPPYYTITNVQFICKILNDAYNQGLEYDVSDMYQRVLVFGMKSHHQPQEAVKLIGQAKFASTHTSVQLAADEVDSNLVFFDVEVFPNLFILCYKRIGEKNHVVSMINPTAKEIEEFVKFPLVGFNNRRYDNHILYSRILGMSELELFDISQRIIKGDKTAFFREAYGLAYADVYDFSVKKQSLKKFELELGIHHEELGYDWMKSVPEEDWMRVAKYCENDVVATEAVFNARIGDYNARKILSKLSGLSVSTITSAHMAKILFGDVAHPETEFVYTDLSKMFPKYRFEFGKTYWGDKEYGEGGLAASRPGCYANVRVLDIASMHPSSAIALNYFGPYTKRFEEILQARLALKHNDKEKISSVLDGMLIPYAKDDTSREALAYALKICINQVYGLTSAKFPNKFRDPRNIDNIVAKRGELFMLTLLDNLAEFERNGTFGLEDQYLWCHVKTDSIKLINPNPDLEKWIIDFGQQYGYTFELEEVYDRMVLIDKSQYIALEEGKSGKFWTATGAFFARPYVFKVLFTKETIELEDMSETIETHTGRGLYLIDEEKSIRDYVGRIGAFTPVKKENGGLTLVRLSDTGYSAPAGTKGYFWMETEKLRRMPNAWNLVDTSYYEEQLAKAKSELAKHFRSDIYEAPDGEETAVEYFCNPEVTTEELLEVLTTELDDGLPF